MILLLEKFDFWRVLAMGVMIGGMFIVVFESNISSSTGADSKVYGYAIVILSLIVFALYEIMFEIFYPGEHDPIGKNEYKPSLMELDEGRKNPRPQVGKNWETLNFVVCMG